MFILVSCKLKTFQRLFRKRFYTEISFLALYYIHDKYTVTQEIQCIYTVYVLLNITLCTVYTIPQHSRIVALLYRVGTTIFTTKQNFAFSPHFRENTKIQQLGHKSYVWRQCRAGHATIV